MLGNRRYSRFRNYLYTRMVARTVKLRPILPQANSPCYKVDATSVNLFSDFTIRLENWAPILPPFHSSTDSR